MTTSPSTKWKFNAIVKTDNGDHLQISQALSATAQGNRTTALHISLAYSSHFNLQRVYPMPHINRVWARFMARLSAWQLKGQNIRERRRLLYEEADSVLEDLGLTRDQLRGSALRRAHLPPEEKSACNAEILMFPGCSGIDPNFLERRDDHVAAARTEEK